MFLSHISNLVTPPAIESIDNDITPRHGTQGTLDRASNALLENEFGTKHSADVVTKILEQGDVKETKVGNFDTDQRLSLTQTHSRRRGRAKGTRQMVPASASWVLYTNNLGTMAYAQGVVLGGENDGSNAEMRAYKQALN